MTRVIGQIETLKRLKATLSHKGIARFSSIGGINNFIKNYDHEKEELFFKIEHDFDFELDTFQAEVFNLQQDYDNLKTNAETRLTSVIESLKTKCNSLRLSPAKNAVIELGNWYLLQIVLGLKFILQKTINPIVWLQTYKTNKRLKLTLNELNGFVINRQAIIATRCEQKLKDLEYTKAVVTELYPIIAGAIGENLVEKQLKKLSDENILFNDFSIDFEKPIYYKKDNNRIFSIQIDHLLINKSGLFVIETKNWSKKSIESLDLRSPIKQILRSSFALYATLTYAKQLDDKLPNHHWGEKKIPIRSIVVMIKNKPKTQFNFIEVLTLEELNGYVGSYDPIFDDSEVDLISNYLSKMKN